MTYEELVEENERLRTILDSRVGRLCSNQCPWCHQFGCVYLPVGFNGSADATCAHCGFTVRVHQMAKPRLDAPTSPTHNPGNPGRGDADPSEGGDGGVAVGAGDG